MASIFSEIELDWDGRTYYVTPSMKLINRIEQDVSLASLARRVSMGDTPFSHVATVFTHLLKAAGCNTNEELVFQALFSNKDGENLRNSLNTVLSAFFPSTDSGEDLKKSQTEK